MSDEAEQVGLNTPLSEIENCDVILLIGSHIQKDQPLAALRVRKAFRQSAPILAVNMVDYDFHFELSAKCITAPHHFVNHLAGIAKILNNNS